MANSRRHKAHPHLILSRTIERHFLDADGLVSFETDCGFHRRPQCASGLTVWFINQQRKAALSTACAPRRCPAVPIVPTVDRMFYLLSVPLGGRPAVPVLPQ